MPQAIICAIVSAAGVVISAAIAFITALCTSKSEFRKLKMQLEHDDKRTVETAFSEMVDSVSKYVESGYRSRQRDAMGKILVSMIGADRQMTDALSKLYAAVSGGCERADIQRLLNSVILLKNAPADNKHNH